MEEETNEKTIIIKKEGYDINVLNSILLMVLTISGNYIDSTFTCDVQNYLNNNIIAKNILILFTIYFTLNFISRENKNPLELCINAIFIWTGYIFFMKQRIMFIAISTLLLMLTHFFDTYVKYYRGLYNEYKEKKYLENKEMFVKIRKITFYITILSVLFGFAFYAKEKYYDEGYDIKTIFSMLFEKEICI